MRVSKCPPHFIGADSDDWSGKSGERMVKGSRRKKRDASPINPYLPAEEQNNKGTIRPFVFPLNQVLLRCPNFFTRLCELGIAE